MEPVWCGAKGGGVQDLHLQGEKGEVMRELSLSEREGGTGKYTVTFPYHCQTHQSASQNFGNWSLSTVALRGTRRRRIEVSSE